MWPFYSWQLDLSSVYFVKNQTSNNAVTFTQNFLQILIIIEKILL